MATNQINPKMITLARQSRGLTQSELASLLPIINQSHLSKIEKGLQPLSEETLKHLAKALNYPIDFFYQNELKTPFSNIYFRKRTTIAQKKLDLIFADVQLILKGMDILVSEVELPVYARYNFNVTEGWTPMAIAARMREIMSIPAGPIKNLVEALEEEGIVVYFYDSPEDKFDGLTSYTDTGVPVIFVNKNMPNDRLRFTICHEFGHLVTHIPCDVEPWRDVEQEANDFASEFLMPKKDCYRDLRALTYPKLTGLKAYWGVSKAAIIRRAMSLGTITQASYKYLMIELGRRGERKSESGYVEIDEPTTIQETIKLVKSLNHTDEIIASNMIMEVDDYHKYFDPQSAKVKVRSIRKAI